MTFCLNNSNVDVLRALLLLKVRNREVPFHFQTQEKNLFLNRRVKFQGITNTFINTSFTRCSIYYYSYYYCYAVVILLLNY